MVHGGGNAIERRTAYAERWPRRGNVSAIGAAVTVTSNNPRWISVETNRNALIVGASSGIGWELARVLHVRGYRCCVAARRLGRLRTLQQALGGQTLARELDINDAGGAMQVCEALIDEMGGLDLVVIASGVGDINPALSWSTEALCIQTNVTGFAAVANVAIRHFENSGRGHLVGISSIAALRGSKSAPAYNASKAFMSNYLEGLRQRVSRFGDAIAVTDVRPGFVDTAMAKGENQFWVTPADRAASQIADAIEARRAVVYVSRRWRLIAWLLKFVPEATYRRL